MARWLKRSKRKRKPERTSRLWDPQRWGLGVGVVVGLTWILSSHLMPSRVPWREGDVADKDLPANRTLVYYSEVATQALREQAARAVRPQYSDPVVGDVLEEVDRLFQEIRNAALQEEPAELKVTPLEAVLTVQPGKTEAERRALLLWALRQDPRVLENLQRIIRRTVDDLMARGIREGTTDLERARQEVAARVAEAGLQQERAKFVRLFAQALLRPNQRYDAEATERLRAEARQSVKPVLVTLYKGELLIRKGERVTPLHLEKFEKLGLIHPRRDYGTTFFLGCLVGLMVILLGIYLHQRQPQVYQDTRRLVLLSVIVSVALLVFKVRIFPEFGYLVMLCTATAGMLVAILIEAHLSFLVITFMALLMGVAAESDWRVTAEAWLSGVVAIQSVTRVVHRAHLIRAGFLISAANVVILLILDALSHAVPGELLRHLLWGGINGMLSFAFTISSIPLLERLFGVTTPFRLLELASPSEPLLQRLLTEAPGTYHASLIIGNLAEAAAEAIGADPLLARTAAYYHDIGKMNRPYCFVENQFGTENIHERLKPMISALVIKSHVKEGVALAREHGLPQVIIDIIEQHHGTQMISFFYQQALEQHGEGEEIPAAQFRYDGPRPRSREAGIIMLADAVEATVRSLQKVTPQRITEAIDRLIRDRLEDGQLDECDLTMRDLRLIAETFATILKGIFHSRIEYPEAGNGSRPESPRPGLRRVPGKSEENLEHAA
jgi:putative nucleotidyltransferase with HDIG domain